MFLFCISAVVFMTLVLGVDWEQEEGATSDTSPSDSTHSACLWIKPKSRIDMEATSWTCSFIHIFFLLHVSRIYSFVSVGLQLTTILSEIGNECPSEFLKSQTDIFECFIFSDHGPKKYHRRPRKTSKYSITFENVEATNLGHGVRNAFKVDHRSSK